MKKRSTEAVTFVPLSQPAVSAIDMLFSDLTQQGWKTDSLDICNIMVLCSVQWRPWLQSMTDTCLHHIGWIFYGRNLVDFIGQISRSGPFCSRGGTYAHLECRVVHCGIWNWCVVGFVQRICWHDVPMIRNLAAQGLNIVGLVSSL